MKTKALLLLTSLLFVLLCLTNLTGCAHSGCETCDMPSLYHDGVVDKTTKGEKNFLKAINVLTFGGLDFVMTTAENINDLTHKNKKHQQIVTSDNATKK